MTRSMAAVVEGQDRASSRMATKPGDDRDFNSSFIVVWVFAEETRDDDVYEPE